MSPGSAFLRVGLALLGVFAFLYRKKRKGRVVVIWSVRDVVCQRVTFTVS